MAASTVIDIEELLVPIAGDNPAGRSLAYEPEYDEIKAARRSEDDTNQGEWQRDTKAADWDRVIELGTGFLRRETKDLLIAAWVTEALTRLHGFDGLHDGLRLLSGIQDRFWETYHPEIEDGDLEAREGPFVFLNELLPMLIRRIPLTSGMGDVRYSFLHWKESRATQNAGVKDPKLAQSMADAGKVTPKQWDDDVAQSPRKFYEDLNESLERARDAFKDFDEGTDRHFGRAAPGLGNIREAMEECRKLIGPILDAKRKQEPDPEPAGEVPDDGPEPEPGVNGADGLEAHGRPAGAGNGLGKAALDSGRLLIEFLDGANALADAGKRLAENRQKYAELQAQVVDLDKEYKEISALVSRNKEYHQLLSRLLELHARPTG
jgi:type VI secretion system protein ImpA